MFYTYVLRSKVNGKTYIGQTKNLYNRIKQHNSGKTSSTKSNKPYDLVYFEQLKTREEALKREKYLKSGIGREFLKHEIKINTAYVVQLDRIPDFGSGG